MAERSASRGGVAWVLAAMFLVMALGGQALGDATVPTGYERTTGQSVSRAGFAYLTGLRTYAAAVLWNSIDPVLDTYFHDVPFDHMRFMLPTITAVVALNPQFTEAYSVGSWIIARNGKLKAGLDLARRGVRDNPHSGTVLVAYAQMLQTLDKNLPAAHVQAAAALRPHTTWNTTAEACDGYRSVLAIMRASHDTTGIARAKAAIKRADAADSQN